MEIKKSRKADLEKKRGIFFEIGLLVGLGFIFLAFQWKSDPNVNSLPEPVEEVFPDEVYIPATSAQAPAQAPLIRLRPSTDFIDIINKEIAPEEPEDIDDVLTDGSENSNEGTETGTGFIGYNNGEGDADEEIYPVADKMPSFNGDLITWLKKNVIYPEAAREFNIQGRVLVQFVVEKDGSITQVKIVRSVDPLLDAEAVRVVKAMPRWNPGRQGVRPVRVSFTLPIVFRLSPF